MLLHKVLAAKLRARIARLESFADATDSLLVVHLDQLRATDDEAIGLRGFQTLCIDEAQMSPRSGSRHLRNWLRWALSGSYQTRLNKPYTTKAGHGSSTSGRRCQAQRDVGAEASEFAPGRGRTVGLRCRARAGARYRRCKRVGRGAPDRDCPVQHRARPSRARRRSGLRSSRSRAGGDASAAWAKLGDEGLCIRGTCSRRDWVGGMSRPCSGPCHRRRTRRRHGG